MVNRPDGVIGPRALDITRAALIRSQSEGITKQLATDGSLHEGGASELEQIGILELLEEDGRPTFIVDVANAANAQPGCLDLLFVNVALRHRPTLLQLVSGVTKETPGELDTSPSAFVDFKRWALSFVSEGEALAISLPTHAYGGSVWTGLTLRKRFRVIACSPSSASPTTDGSQNATDIRHYRGLGSSSSRTSSFRAEGLGYFGVTENNSSLQDNVSTRYHRRIKSNDLPIQERRVRSDTEILTLGDARPRSRLAMHKPRPPPTQVEVKSPLAMKGSEEHYTDKTRDPDQGFFDWTRLPDSAALPHIQFARSVNWAATRIGPIESWCPHLRAMCNLLMASPNPAAMYWGKEMVTIYNEAYILIAGSKHPELMGMTYRAAWIEIWDEIKDILAAAFSSAQATMKDNDKLFLNRNGFLEECYFSWSIIPLIGADGSVAGLYNPAYENTRRVVAERQMLMLRGIGESTASARQVSEFWPLILQGLEKYEVDAPFVIVYSVTEAHDSGTSSPLSTSTISQKALVLEGTLGVPVGHKAAPGTIDLTTSSEGFASVFRNALKTDKPVILSKQDGTLDQELVEGILWRGYGDPSSTVVVYPIHATMRGANLGFVVAGTNPRRPFDEDYSLYVQLFARQLTTSVASVLLFEDEIRRGERAARLAAQDRIDLSNQLAQRTQEAVESEIKFTRMAEMAPVGMFIASPTGRFNYCNDAWYNLCSYPKGGAVGEDWLDYIAQEDRAAATKEWKNFLDERAPLSSVFRFKTPWKDGEDNEMSHTWVLASAHPEICPDGRVKRIFGSVTDISAQIRAEELQKRRVEEAIENKRQQEQFIDLICHEMRNPLSAILQCADEVASSLLEIHDNETMDTRMLESSIDAAQTITLCAQHQKRIVDDVLTLGKLDSTRLLVTPIDKRPASVVEHALRMFEGELQTADISLDFQVDQSLHDLKVEWVRLDPSRLLQVLINLTTNAIKFTTTQDKRSISVRLAASLQPPSESAEKSVDYVPSRTPERDAVSSPEWGSGQPIYLVFSIKDTGRGLTDDEKKLLFLRFSQASRLTHVNYGGSGLGLFICRELVELQGGEIGVSSKAGIGSTFAFYIKVRRSSAPKTDTEESLPRIHTRKNSGTRSSRILIPNHKVTDSGNHDTSGPLAPVPKEAPLKVLIVEDNLVNQKVLAKQLQNKGCEVHLANHGGEAIDTLMKSWFWQGLESTGIQIDVVLMDMEMPVMDGLTATKKIRDLERNNKLVSHVPVISVTANARAEQVLSTQEAGVDDVMSKPFRIPELIPKIRSLAEKYTRKGAEGT